ncbi:hypothetical protein LO771_07650 [Streptacidiphilus sp. ASG 303]|uniref:hypothetical protein n=1 Tax=Streptacidiphilus sp. ASG 303 TaxID=2896847 RepID=UPI001E5D646E|nr:hypothetical protein [Streptacidiphilus sp. ASG 303]MCD0482290.1 hypothetical protein [Streptacidiphilus sp. ASG 303]
MNDLDPPVHPDPAAHPVAPPVALPAPPPVPPPAPRAGQRPARRRTALRALAAVAAAAAAGAGIGEVLLHTAYRDAGAAAAAPAAAAPAAAPSPSPSFGARSNGNHFGPLRGLLLPVPDGYRPGPDHGELGNDTELDGGQLAARMRQALREVPRKNRSRVESAWRSLHLRASGLRTYRSDDGAFMVEMSLDQFNQHAVKAAGAFESALVDVSGAFRRGPAVPGHPGARCVLPPVEPSAQIDYMTCFAAEGDLLVTMETTGVAPLNKDQAVQLFKSQLDRLAPPGAAV